MGRLSDSIKRLSSSLGFSKPEDAAEVQEEKLDLSRLQDSESESEIEQDKPSTIEEEDEDEEDEEDQEQEEDVPLSDVELDDDADVVTHQKTTVNNRAALRQSLKSIELPAAARANFYELMTISAPEAITLKDIYDDTERELAFYKQSLAAASDGRKQLKKLKIPFSRPVDYFAEMVKSDEHMDRLKQKLVTDETSKKASQEARRQRELKKFGKKVQHAKLQERQKEKRDTLDKIKSLKRKRNNDDMSGDQFDVEIEDALKDKKKERDDKYRLGGSKGGAAGGRNNKRDAKNAKYGFGAKKDRRNTAQSSGDMSDFQHSKKKRLGKSRRK